MALESIRTTFVNGDCIGVKETLLQKIVQRLCGDLIWSRGKVVQLDYSQHGFEETEVHWEFDRYPATFEYCATLPHQTTTVPDPLMSYDERLRLYIPHDTGIEDFTVMPSAYAQLNPTLHATYLAAQPMRERRQRELDGDLVKGSAVRLLERVLEEQRKDPTELMFRFTLPEYAHAQELCTYFLQPLRQRRQSSA